MKKRILALLLVLCMVMSLLSMTAWAAGDDIDDMPMPTQVVVEAIETMEETAEIEETDVLDAAVEEAQISPAAEAEANNSGKLARRKAGASVAAAAAEDSATDKIKVTVNGTDGNYNSLQEAIDAAITGAGESGTAIVKLNGDVTLSSTLTIAAEKTVTIDLNGSTISYGTYFAIKNSGNLTIQDTSNNAAGKITAEAVIMNYSGATLELKSGTIEGTYYQTMDNCGILKITGATISNTNSNIGIRNYGSSAQMTVSSGNVEGSTAIRNYSAGTLEVSGGTITGTIRGIWNYGANSNVIVTGTSEKGISGATGILNGADDLSDITHKVTVSGGTVTGSNGNGILNICGGVVEVKGTASVSGTTNGINCYGGNTSVTVSGGTVSGTSRGIWNYGSNANVTVSGSANIEGKKGDGILNGATDSDVKPVACGTLTVTGGSVSGSQGIWAIGSKVDASGGTVTGTGTSSNGFAIEAGATGTISGNVEISGVYGVVVEGYSDYATYSTPYVNEQTTPSTKLTVSGGTITASTFALCGNGSWDHTDITISGGSITSTGATAIYHPQVGNLTISDGTIEGAAGGVQYCGMGTLTISGGTIKSTYQYTEFPNKSKEQGDGSAADGAALSILSRGGGYQDAADTMTVNITGGKLESTNNSAIEVYRFQQDGDTKEWKIDDATGLPNYLNSLSISGGEFSSGSQKTELDIDSEAASAVSVTGGIFSQEVDSNYVKDGKTCIDNTDASTKGAYRYRVGIAVTGLTLDATAETTYGTDRTLKATTVPTSGYTNPIVWTSDDTSIATVDANGVVTPQKAGKTTITATVDKQTATCEVTVNPKETTMDLTASTNSLEGGGTVTLILNSGEAAAKDVTVKCSDSSITVTPNSDGTYTATLPNATVNYTFTAALTSDYYKAETASAAVSVTRYVAATTTTTTTTSNKTETTTETLPTETGETANTQVGEEAEPVEVISTETVTDAETGTVTTTTEKSDGSTTVVEEKTDGTVTTTDTTADGAVKSVEEKPDGTLTTTDTATTGVQVVTVEAPSQQVTAKVTIPEEIETATVTIPVAGELTAGMVAMDADTGEIIMLSALTDDGLTVKLDGSKNIVIVDNSKDFDDVPENNWVTDGIDYATAHNLFGGKSETTFDPNGDMTRAMLMTVLARFEGVDTELGATWYEAGMNWAVENEISDGSDPNGSITREQLATMLYRYAGSPKVDGTITGFTDSHEISSYASDAMIWAISQGILTGNNRGELNPTATATRGQVATMMMRFGQGQVK